MIHIASWNYIKSLFKESGKLLKIQNKLQGVKYIGKVSKEAIKHGFVLDELFSMPANNFSVIYRKKFYKTQPKYFLKY